MAALFGLHVGNSSACLAICKDEGRVDVVANEAGNRITPTILQWTPNGCILGRTAQLELFRNSGNTIIRNKQLCNSNISNEEVDHLKNQVSYKIYQSNAEYKYEILYEGKQYHVFAKEIASWIFKKLFSIAQSAVGGKKEINVVLTVPLYYSQKSIQLTKEAAHKAGFNVLQIVDEASTAALGCSIDLDPKEPPYYCLVYRVGGVSVDATILLVQDGILSIVEHAHIYNLGGASFTEKLYEFLASEFNRLNKGVEISERGKYKLFAAAETVKQVLSIQNVAQCSCESIGNGYDFNCSISRARFENLIAQLIPSIVAPILEVINKANLLKEKIRKVVTCGGTLKTPKLQETIQRLLSRSEILSNSCPDEVIALGAAKQAGYLVGYKYNFDTLSVDTPSLSTSLLVKVKKEGEEEIIHVVPENSVVPLRKQYKITSPASGFVVSLTDKNNKILGTTSINNLDLADKFYIGLDIFKEGKILLTLTNDATKEKTCIKSDLNEISKI